MTITSQTNVSCNGGSDGEATLDASGGTGPYTFDWAPISVTEDTVSGLSAGTYYITITDNIGCDTLDSVIITEPPVLDVTATSTPATCGSADGTATATASGGVGSYSYSWFPIGGSNATATGLVPGDYTVTVIDGNLCSDSYVVTVDAIGGPNIFLASSTGVSCYGDTDGTATVTANGGVPPYSYIWSPGTLTGDTQTGLAAGNYSVTVQDAAGCSDNMTVTIGSPAQLQLSPAGIIAATCGASDGQGGVFVSGGTGPYTYTWTPGGATTQTITPVAAGEYGVVVVDNNGCSESINVVVPNTGGPTVAIVSTTDVSCYGMNDGSAEVSAAGGTSPYSYSWSPMGGNGTIASNLPGGTYNVLVTGADGCLGYTSITIDEPDEIVISSTVVNEDCAANNGGIFAFASGGAGGLTYLWSPDGQTTTSIVNIPNGNYSLTVTDFDGCTATEFYSVTVIYDPNNPNNPDLTVSPDTLISLFEGNQEQLDVSGAVTYSWTPSGDLSCDDCPDPVVTATTEQYYTVYGFNANNCWDSAIVHITIRIPCGDLFVPTIFSPNGDGLNDEFRILGTCIDSYEYAVYNRWGQRIKLITSDDILQSWNGKIDGEPVMNGSYAYTFKARYYDDSEKEFDYEEHGILKIVR